MKSAFAMTWNRSVQRRKQRKFRFNAPANVKGKFLGSPLSKELREKYTTRAVRVRVGDKVKVTRGEFKGVEGVVERVDVGNTLIYVPKVERIKHDGSKSPLGIHPSNVKITELKLDDKKRKAKLEKK